MIILKLRSALNLDYFLLLKKINKNRNNQIRVWIIILCHRAKASGVRTLLIHSHYKLFYITLHSTQSKKGQKKKKKAVATQTPLYSLKSYCYF